MLTLHLQIATPYLFIFSYKEGTEGSLREQDTVRNFKAGENASGEVAQKGRTGTGSSVHHTLKYDFYSNGNEGPPTDFKQGADITRLFYLERVCGLQIGEGGTRRPVPRQ